MAQKFGSGISIKSILSEESLKLIDEMSKEKIQIIKIPLSDIDSFPNHPYYVKDDEAMSELTESIKNNGILTPITVRKKDNGRYELISGHRRRRACELAELKEIPALIIRCTDEDAVIQMVDANLQRPKILPSEKAFAYKMKLEAMKRKAGRPSKENATPVVSDFDRERSNEVLASEVGESREQIRRYIRLTYLIPEFLQKVDNDTLPFRTGVEISYLSEEEQRALHKAATIPTLAQAFNLKNYSKIQALTFENIQDVLKGKDPFKVIVKQEPVVTTDVTDTSDRVPAREFDSGYETRSIIQKLLTQFGNTDDSEQKPQQEIQKSNTESIQAPQTTLLDCVYKNNTKQFILCADALLQNAKARWNDADYKLFNDSLATIKRLIWQHEKN